VVRYLTVSGDPADDVASEAWMAVVKGLPTFRGDETAWRAWVFTIVRRRAIDAGRRRQRVRLLDEEWRRSVSHPRPGDAADLALERIGTDEALRLVAQLPALQAEAVMLRVVAGLPVESVSAVLGRSPGAIRVATHRGLGRLRAELEARGVTESRPDALHGAT
jgi:RNA polymerase sigma-70 factor, ECF subfamily